MEVDEGHRMNSRSVQLILAAMKIMHHPQTGLLAHRHQKLRTFACWPDKAEAIKAVLIFHHGYGEHLGRQAIRRARFKG